MANSLTDRNCTMNFRLRFFSVESRKLWVRDLTSPFEGKQDKPGAFRKRFFDALIFWRIHHLVRRIQAERRQGCGAEITHVETR